MKMKRVTRSLATNSDPVKKTFSERGGYRRFCALGLVLEEGNPGECQAHSEK
jgi:hypothetical protein